MSSKDYDKNKFYLQLDIKTTTGTWETGVITVDEVLNSQTYTWSLSSFTSILYQKVPTRNKADIRIRCGTTINGTQKENEVFGVMSVQDSNPTFNTYSYGDANSTTQSVLGNTSYIPTGYGDMQAHISVANKAVAKNYAQIVSYSAKVYSSTNVLMVSKSVEFKDDSQVDISFGNFKTADTYTIKINAVDSRGNVSDIISKTFYVLDYHIPQTSVIGERQNGYEEDTILQIHAAYSTLDISGTSKNDSFNIKYRYAIVGQDLPSSYTTVTSIINDTSVSNPLPTDTYKTATINISLPSSNSYSFEFVSTDKMNNSATTKITVAQGIPLMAQMEDGHVVVGCTPDFSNDSLLQVGSDIMATDESGTKVNVLNKINSVNSTLSNSINELNNNLSNKSNTDHTHNYLYNTTLNEKVSFVADGDFGVFRPDTASLVYSGSSTRPWYKTFTERLEVTTNRPIFQPTYDNTVTYATNCYVSTSGTLSRTTNTSSKTIKHDIQELQEDSELNADKLYDVNIYQFKYNGDIVTDVEDARYDKDLVGFIIEDLNEKYPIAVDKPSDNVKEWSWNAQYLIPPMLKLIQKQHEEIENMKLLINKIKQQLSE